MKAIAKFFKRKEFVFDKDINLSRHFFQYVECEWWPILWLVDQIRLVEAGYASSYCQCLSHWFIYCSTFTDIIYINWSLFYQVKNDYSTAADKLNYLSSPAPINLHWIQSKLQSQMVLKVSERCRLAVFIFCCIWFQVNNKTSKNILILA